MAMHPDRFTVATGQVASALDGSYDNPFVCIWDVRDPLGMICRLNFPSDGAPTRCGPHLGASRFAPASFQAHRYRPLGLLSMDEWVRTVKKECGCVRVQVRGGAGFLGQRPASGRGDGR